MNWSYNFKKNSGLSSLINIQSNTRQLAVSLYGCGETPEELTVYILALTEEEWEEWDEEKLRASVEPIILTSTT